MNTETGIEAAACRAFPGATRGAGHPAPGIDGATQAGPTDSGRCRQKCRDSMLDGPRGTAYRAARTRGRASVVRATDRWRPRETGSSRFFRPGVGIVNPLRGIGGETNRGDTMAGIRSAFATFILRQHRHPA